MLLCRLVGLETDDDERADDRDLAFDQMAGQLRSALDQFTKVRLVPFWVIVVLILVYLVLIGPGDYFGEMSLIDSAPRSATVTAGPDGVKTFAISALTFGQLMDANPPMVRDLVGVLTARIRAIESSPSSGW